MNGIFFVATILTTPDLRCFNYLQPRRLSYPLHHVPTFSKQSAFVCCDLYVYAFQCIIHCIHTLYSFLIPFALSFSLYPARCLHTQLDAKIISIFDTHKQFQCSIQKSSSLFSCQTFDQTTTSQSKMQHEAHVRIEYMPISVSNWNSSQCQFPPIKHSEQFNHFDFNIWTNINGLEFIIRTLLDDLLSQCIPCMHNLQIALKWVLFCFVPYIFALFS